MLTNVPEAINRSSRNVVINHPNSYNCYVFRRKILRSADTSVGGLPTLGGMSVISADDESEYTYELLGDGFALSTDKNVSGTMMDRRDASNGEDIEFRYLIEPAVLEGSPGGFSIKKNDVIYLILGGALLAREIVAVETVNGIPPYSQRYVCNARDDLNMALLEAQGLSSISATGEL